MNAVLTVKYKILLLVVSTAVLLSGVNLYIIKSYQEPLQQYDTMIGNIIMANSSLIITREIVDKDFYSTLSNLKDDRQKHAFISKVRSLQESITNLKGHLLTTEESTSLEMISRMMHSFITVCLNILDDSVPMADKLEDYERATTIQTLLSKNMGEFISLQIQNRNRVAEDLEKTTNRLWFVSILTLTIILLLCIFWAMFYANKIAESIYQEMSQQKKAEKLAQHQAEHDTLTNLPNRRLFEKFTTNLIQTKPHLRMAVLFIDLDGFKAVNDTHGHDIGDNLLIHYANIFTSCVRADDMVCRFGGDEFVIAVNQSTREIVERIVNRILDEVRQPCEINNLTLNTTVSIGISCYPNTADTLETLILAADRSMYLAKKAGKNNFVFASDATHPPANKSGGIQMPTKYMKSGS